MDLDVCRSWTEMGYFQVDDQGNWVNEYAWNNVANMLYLEVQREVDRTRGFRYVKIG